VARGKQEVAAPHFSACALQLAELAARSSALVIMAVAMGLADGAEWMNKERLAPFTAQSAASTLYSPASAASIGFSPVSDSVSAAEGTGRLLRAQEYVMSPFQFSTRSNAAQAHRDLDNFDVRVRQPSPGPEPWPTPWPGDVSLRDMLGASLVTYEQYLDDSQTAPTVEDLQSSLQQYGQQQALEPKAVYVQYPCTDPVTGEMAPVVVPAQMSLDVFADPLWWGTTPEEEEVIEEEKDEDEDEERRKLRSSIKGDPILMRAKPAPPPDPYFAPIRHENLHSELPDSIRNLGKGSMSLAQMNLKAQGAAVAASVLQGMGVAAKASELGQARVSPATEYQHVAAASTMSSFLKASGKDKYTRSRIGEIDRLLKPKLPQDGLQDSMMIPVLQEQLSPQRRAAGAAERGSPVGPGASPGGTDASHGPATPRSRRGARPQSGQSPRPLRSGPRVAEDPAALAAHMAMHIQRMPQFHKGRLVQLDGTGGSLATDTSAGEAGDGAAANVGEEGAATAMPGDGIQAGRMSPSQGADAALSTAPAGPAGVTADASPGTPRKSGASESRLRAGLRSGAKVVLRDLDPHIDMSNIVPSQRMHNNWPDGPRRQLARHFYGMSPRQILEEEEKERLQEKLFARKAKDTEPNNDTELNLSDPNSPKAKARQRNLERSLAIGTEAEGGVITHRLEVRIRNADKAERFVVGRHTERLRRGESACRPCSMLHKLDAPEKLKY